MTKRNAHARQRRYTKLLAMVTAVTPAGLAFWAGCDGVDSHRVAGARHVGSFPHGCASSATRDSRQVAVRRGRLYGRSRGKRSLRQPWGITQTAPARGAVGGDSGPNETRDRCPVIRVSPQVGNSWVVVGSKVSRGRLRDFSERSSGVVSGGRTRAPSPESTVSTLRTEGAEHEMQRQIDQQSANGQQRY